MAVTWESIHDSYLGRIGLILANGTGLKDIPTALLRKYHSFGTNKIFLLPNFTADFYVVTNPLVYSANRDEIADYPSKLKFSKFDDLEGLHYETVTSPRFVKDPRQGLHEGYTVTHICLQLAYWMGFDTVLLVGLDHYYQTPRTESNAKRVVETEDRNHFTPEYFPPGTTWNLPDLDQSDISYRAALKAYHEDHRLIYNISTFSMCDVFPRRSYRYFL